MMMYNVQISDKARKALKKIDQRESKIIILWIEKNLEGCENPRLHGKALTGDKKGYWRYRVGSYRLIAEINDAEIKIFLVNVAHRRDAYK